MAKGTSVSHTALKELRFQTLLVAESVLGRFHVMCIGVCPWLCFTGSRKSILSVFRAIGLILVLSKHGWADPRTSFGRKGNSILKVFLRVARFLRLGESERKSVHTINFRGLFPSFFL